MDLADIPAAAAFLQCAELPSASSDSAASASTSARAPTATPRPATCLMDLSSGRSGSMMNPHTSAAAAAALLGAAHHFYPVASVADAVNATMAQQYYATQNLASFANVAGFMPMYGLSSLNNMFVPQQPQPQMPASFFHGAHHMAVTTSSMASPQSAACQVPQSGPHVAPQLDRLDAYDIDPGMLHSQITAQFTQSTPQQQTAYYEDIRQQLDAAAAKLDDSQKQVLLSIDPSLSFTMKPLELEEHDIKPEHDDSSSASTPTSSRRGAVKRPRTISIAATTPTAAAATTKKPRKNKAFSCEPPVGDMADAAAACEGGLLNEESTGASSSSSATPSTTPRATPRGRPPGAARAAAAAAASAAGHELTPSGKKKSMTPQAEEMRARKAKMTWPKGTFIIRLQDVKVRSGRDHIWLIDNHQLLQRFNNEEGGIRADGSRVYHKTDRYTGWLCHEGYHYFPLFDQQHIVRQDGDTVTVMFPQEDELQQAIDYLEQEKVRRADIKEEEVSRPLPPSLRNEPARLALLLEQQRADEAMSMTLTESTSTMMTSSPSSSSRYQRAGLGGQMKRSRAHTVSSPSCSSMSMAASSSDLPSTSRRNTMTMHEMPSLSRAECWALEDDVRMFGGHHHHHVDDDHVLTLNDDRRSSFLLDDDVNDDRRHDQHREFKQEEADYQEYDDLADLVYSGMP